MKSTKKLVSVIVALCMILTLSVGSMMSSYAAVPEQYKDSIIGYGNALVAMDLLSGTGDANDNLKIDNGVTRQEAITMILSFMNEAGEAKKMAETDITAALAKYTDADKISAWARPLVAYATSKGYVGGRTDGSYDPLGAVKGYEFGIMLYNGMAYVPGTGYDTNFAFKNLAKKSGFAATEVEAYLASLNGSELSRGICMATMYGALGVARQDTGVSQMEYLIANGKVTQDMANAYFYKSAPTPPPATVEPPVSTVATEPTLCAGAKNVEVPMWKVNTAIGGLENLPDAVLDSSKTNVTPELKAAMKNATFTGTPRNIILLIGDGMGITHVKASENWRGELIMTQLPYKAESKTKTADNAVTDSCAGGTAIATGYKTKYGYISLDKDGNEVKNIGELARSLGKKIGIVSSDHVGDATPATMIVHNASRDNQGQIYYDEFMWAPDILMGGGSWAYSDIQSAGLATEAEMDAYLAANGIGYYKSFADTVKATDSKIYSLYNDLPSKASDRDASLPNHAQMLTYSLAKLQEKSDEAGFFLMLEDTWTDGCGHDGDLEGTLDEVQNFDETIALAVKFVLENPDTLLVVTADHETGGMKLRTGWETDKTKIKFPGGGHSSQNVPVYAFGCGAEKFASAEPYENEIIGQTLGALMGDATFGNVAK